MSFGGERLTFPKLSMGNVQKLLNEYANAHSKLPVYNAAQWIAREIPIRIAREM